MNVVRWHGWRSARLDTAPHLLTNEPTHAAARESLRA